jgi:hypothetical protein
LVEATQKLDQKHAAIRRELTEDFQQEENRLKGELFAAELALDSLQS